MTTSFPKSVFYIYVVYNLLFLKYVNKHHNHKHYYCFISDAFQVLINSLLFLTSSQTTCIVNQTSLLFFDFFSWICKSLIFAPIFDEKMLTVHRIRRMSTVSNLKCRLLLIHSCHHLRIHLSDIVVDGNTVVQRYYSSHCIMKSIFFF